MKLAIIGFLVVLFCTLILASPAGKGTTSPCGKNCEFDYTPVCATPKNGKGKDLSFGNDCVLGKYNCEHAAEPYVKKSAGECPGSTGIRLQ